MLALDKPQGAPQRQRFSLFTLPDTLSRWPFLIDTPFSFALDTVLLPYDLTAFLPQDMGGDPQECVISNTLNVM